VLKCGDYLETSKIVTVLTPDRGKLAGLVKGAKRPRSRFGSSLEPVTYIELLFYEKEGAYTGEVSGEMIKDAGCKYVIVGHSERREYFGDTDETVNKKIHAALIAGLSVMFCLGESLQERESERTFDVIERQVKAGLTGCGEKEMKNIVIAYEPIWAIGTGKTATPDQANEVHSYIRNLLSKIIHTETASRTRILYGGSVKPSNARELMGQDDIDGALVGGASLTADSFSEIILSKSIEN